MVYTLFILFSRQHHLDSDVLSLDSKIRIDVFELPISMCWIALMLIDSHHEVWLIMHRMEI